MGVCVRHVEAVIRDQFSPLVLYVCSEERW